jgi:hypothetical protein
MHRADTGLMRIARIIAPHVFYHLIWRFVDHSWFFTDDHERAMYLRLLERALARSEWRCLSYALMSSHIHLGAIAGRDPLENWAKSVGSPFARWMNRRHGRLGPVIADRPDSYAIASERERYVVAYIHNNPVRARVVASARDSNWTSHRVFERGGNGLIDAAFALERWGFDSYSQLDAWVSGEPGESGVPDMRAVRKAARRRAAVEVATPMSPRTVPLVARSFVRKRVDPRMLVLVAANAVGVASRDVISRARNPHVVAARSVAVALADQFGVCGSDIAAALGVSAGAVTRIRQRPRTPLVGRVLEGAVTRVEIELAP